MPSWVQVHPKFHERFVADVAFYKPYKSARHSLSQNGTLDVLKTLMTLHTSPEGGYSGFRFKWELRHPAPDTRTFRRGSAPVRGPPGKAAAQGHWQRPPCLHARCNRASAGAIGNRGGSATGAVQCPLCWGPTRDSSSRGSLRTGPPVLPSFGAGLRRPPFRAATVLRSRGKIRFVIGTHADKTLARGRWAVASRDYRNQSFQIPMMI